MPGLHGLGWAGRIQRSGPGQHVSRGRLDANMLRPSVTPPSAIGGMTVRPILTCAAWWSMFARALATRSSAQGATSPNYESVHRSSRNLVPRSGTLDAGRGTVLVDLDPKVEGPQI
jgi:hypothetical protein